MVTTYGSMLAGVLGWAEIVSRVFNAWKRQSTISQLAGYYCLENRETLEHEAEL